MHAFDLGPAPIAKDEDGVLRVAGTRVTLDSIVTAFDLGATPGEIVQRYPSVDLASAYALIAYVLRHRESVDVYLTERARAASDAQTEVEARFRRFSLGQPRKLGFFSRIWVASPKSAKTTARSPLSLSTRDDGSFKKEIAGSPIAHGGLQPEIAFATGQ